MIQVFNFVDGLLPFSGIASICLWAGVAGMLSMYLYKWFSPQNRLEELMVELDAAQKELNDYDGEFDGMLPLLKRTLGLASKRVWMSFGPSLVAAAPLILIMICIGYQLDQSPQQYSAVAESADVENTDFDPQPISVASETDIHVTSSDEHAGLGPGWMQSWIFVFVVVSSCSALAVRQFGGII